MGNSPEVSAAQLRDQPPDEPSPAAARLDRRQLFAILEQGKAFLDLVWFREASGGFFGKKQLAAAEHVKLAETAGSYFDLFAKAGLQRCGQTGRSIFVASGLAVKNAGAHDRSLRVVAGNLKRGGVADSAWVGTGLLAA